MKIPIHINWWWRIGILLSKKPWEHFRTFQRSRIFRDKVRILNHACLNLHWLGMRTFPRPLQTCGGMFRVLCFGLTWLGFVDKLDRHEGAGAWLMSGRFELDRAWIVENVFRDRFLRFSSSFGVSWSAWLKFRRGSSKVSPVSVYLKLLFSTRLPRTKKELTISILNIHMMEEWRIRISPLFH